MPGEKPGKLCGILLAIVLPMKSRGVEHRLGLMLRQNRAGPLSVGNFDVVMGEKEEVMRIL